MAEDCSKRAARFACYGPASKSASGYQERMIATYQLIHPIPPTQQSSKARKATRFCKAYEEPQSIKRLNILRETHAHYENAPKDFTARKPNT